MNKPGWFRPTKTEGNPNETWLTSFLIVIKRILTSYYKRIDSKQYLAAIIREIIASNNYKIYKSTHSKQQLVIMIRELITSSSYKLL